MARVNGLATAQVGVEKLRCRIRRHGVCCAAEGLGGLTD